MKYIVNKIRHSVYDINSGLERGDEGNRSKNIVLRNLHRELKETNIKEQLRD